jgi:D-alanyl-D-alanine carboxypeptidase
MPNKILPIIFTGLFVILIAITFIFFGKNLFPKSLSQTSTSTLLDNYQHPLIPKAVTNKKPELTAEDYILIDNTTNTILLSQNPNNRIYPASITKLATALTALNIYPLDELVTVKDAYKNGQVMDLVPGETLTVKSLVSALLVHSANDSAYNLAAHHQNGVSGFVKEMNLLISKYGLKNTHFVNFDGLQDPDHYSTVYDLAQLGRIAIKNSVIRETVKNKNIVVTDVTGKIVHNLGSTNELLGVAPEIEGLKTGWTPDAGGCFIALINLHGHEMISVVAQSTDRFADTVKIIDWAKQNVTWSAYQP